MDELVGECAEIAETHARTKHITLEYKGTPSTVRAKRNRRFQAGSGQAGSSQPVAPTPHRRGAIQARSIATYPRNFEHKGERMKSIFNDIKKCALPVREIPNFVLWAISKTFWFWIAALFIAFSVMELTR